MCSATAICGATIWMRRAQSPPNAADAGAYRLRTPTSDSPISSGTLMQLWSDFKKTVVFVTHDVEEAIYLSDEIHVMGTRPGRILETIPIALPRPRVRTSSLTPEFIAIKERCMTLLSASAPALEAA